MQGSVGRAVGEEMATQGLLRTGTDGTLFDTGAASLREAAAARVAAHRSKRAGAQAMEAAREEALRQEQARAERDVRRGASNVRDAVRARYEKSQSYRDFLAAEAERAVQQAQAEAEIAARNAKAIADAQMQLLEELKQEENSAVEAAPVSMMAFEEGRPAFEWDEPRIGLMEEPVAQSGDLFVEPPESLREVSTGGLTVRLYDDVGSMLSPQRTSSLGTPMLSPQRTSSLGTPMLAGLSPAGARSRVFAEDRALESEELAELEQEIAFRRAPEFVDHIIETMPLPANLIEFPRELVATRKARPRLAEGPLREEAVPEPQLRIFEVEPEQISREPVTAEEDVSEAPVWQGMLLDGPMMGPLPRPEAATAVGPVDIAPVSRRLMAAMVDGCCIGAALVGFATVTSYISGPGLQAMSKPMLAGAVAFTFAIAALLYQLLFFSLNEATPGMRYARIGLCTFAEMNPTRKQKRRRVMAQVLAVCPLGLGLLWVLLDDDRLGWHDRISRIYQRSY